VAGSPLDVAEGAATEEARKESMEIVNGEVRA
jgi:hypothetical protein